MESVGSGELEDDRSRQSWGTLRAEQRHTLWASVERTMRADALLSAHLVLAPTRTFEAALCSTPAEVTLLACS